MNPLTHNESRPPDLPDRSFGLVAAGVITAAFGFLTLLGYVLDLPRLADFGLNLIPMAPSTALLFLLYGVALALRARSPLRRRAFWFCGVVGCLGTLVALLLFVLSCLNIHWPVEHLGLNLTGTVGGSPTGYMSPVTAFCFLLVGVSFLASLSRSAIRPGRAALAAGAAALLLLIDFIFLVFYGFGAPLFYGGAFIPPAINTILALTVLGLALLALARWAGARWSKLCEANTRPTLSFTLIFLLLALGIIGISYLYYQNYARNFRAAAESQLLSVAELKVGELVKWRQERMMDAAIFFQNPSFTALVRRFTEQPTDADAHRQLLDWVGKYAKLNDYNQVRLMDLQGVTVLSVPTGLKPASANPARTAAEVLRSGQIVLQDFYRNEHNQRIYLASVVPLIDEATGHRPLGVLALRIDPELYLYPFIKRWPTPSPTAETLLLRRDGNEVLYLNDLRHQSNAALVLRFPLARVEVPAVRVALGQTEIMSGVDYRGVPVLAAALAVPDSPWFLVAKVDAAEVFAPILERFWQVVGMLIILLFAAGVGVGLIWRQQRLRFYRERALGAELLRQSEEQFRAIADYTVDWETWFGTDGKIRWVNPAVERMTGYSAAEVLAHQDFSAHLIAAEDRPLFCAALQDAQRGHKGDNVEFRYVHKNGTPLWLALSWQPILDARGNSLGVRASGRDITARKQAEAALQSSEQRFRMLIEKSPDAHVLGDLSEGRNQGFIDCNQAALDMLGMTSREQLLGSNRTILSPERQPDGQLSSEKSAALIAACLATGCQRFEWVHLKTNGEPLPLEIVMTVLHTGRQMLLHAVWRDIAARKQAESTREKTLSILNETGKTAKVGGWELDLRTGIATWTAETFSIFEIDSFQSEPSLPEGLNCYAPASRPIIEQAVQRAIAHGEPYDLELELVTKKGRRRWVHTTGRALQEQGRTVGLAGIIQDITERKQAEMALRENRAMLKLILDTIPQSIFWKDKAGFYLGCNRNFAQAAGLADPEQIVGQTDFDLPWPRVLSEAYRADDAQVIASGESKLHFVESLQSAGGPTVWVDSSKLPLRDTTQAVQGVLGIFEDITERRAVQEALRREQEFARILLDNISDGVVACDAQGNLVLFNRTARAWHGQDLLALPPEAWGRTYNLYGPDGLQPLPTEAIPLVRALHGETVSDAGMTIVAQGQPPRFIQAAGGPFFDAAHNLLGAVVVMRDITERRQAEAVLRESEANLRQAQEIARLGRCELDLVTNQLVWSDGIFALFEAHRETLAISYDAFLSFIHPDDRALVDQTYRASIANKQPYEIEHRLQMQDGRIKWVNEIGRTDYDAAGHPIRSIGIVQDITERRRLDATLRETQAILQAALDNSSAGIAIANAPDGTLRYVNDAGLLIRGGDRQSIVNGVGINQYVAAWKLLDLDGRPLKPEEVPLARALMFGETNSREFLIQRAVGDERAVLANATPIKDEHGKITAGIVVFVDITERKQAEVALQHSARELQAKNAELERFLYTASHDLKSPVVTVGTFLGYLEQDMAAADAGRIAKDLAFIRAATDKMARLLDDLLELSRVGRVVNLPVRLTFRNLADEALAAVAGRIAGRGVTVQVDEHDVTLLGDPLRLAEIWQNLVENACKFMGDQPAPHITIGVATSGAEPVFFVRDNGIGLDPRFHAKVFNLFEKLNPKAEGTGLGLALIKRIVELYQGRIWVESSGVGQGTCFYFTLPGALSKLTEGEKS